MNKNSLSSNYKTKSGEYVLNRPPKKPGAEEVYDNNTAITISCETASEQENSRKTIADMFKEKNQVTTLAGKEDATNSTATKTTATSTSCCESEWNNFISDIVMESRTLMYHTYGSRRSRLVNPARKWKIPTPQVGKQKQSPVKPTTAGHSQNQTTQGIFIFGSLK